MKLSGAVVRGLAAAALSIAVVAPASFAAIPVDSIPREFTKPKDGAPPPANNVTPPANDAPVPSPRASEPPRPAERAPASPGEPGVPALAGPVVDAAGILDADDERVLESLAYDV
jgi:hypothetical protein